MQPTATTSSSAPIDNRPAFMAEETSVAPVTTPTIPPTDPPTPTSTVSGSGGGNKNLPKIITALGVVILVVATGIGVMLSRNSQLTQTQAADCARYNFTVTQEGVVTVINGSTATVPPNTATINVDNAQAGNFNIPSLAPGQSSQLGSVDVPTTGAFVWEVTSPTTSCSDGGSYASTTGAAVATPSPSTLAQCTAIAAFSPTWEPLTATQLSALVPGSKVRFTVAATSSGIVDMAKFVINGAETAEVTTKRPGTENYYYEYTIPAGTKNFKVSAEVHHEESDTWY